jgi:hypothetical protein
MFEGSGLKQYGMEVNFKGITSVMSFLNYVKWFKSYWEGTTDEQTEW